MKKVAMVVVLLAAAVAGAQEQRTMEISAGMPGPARPAAPPKHMTPEQMKRGRAWMELAEAQAKGLEGGMRAYALLQVAKSLEPARKKHALELLEDALAASKAIEDDGMQTRSRLQQRILQAMVPLGPERADELLTQLDPAGRESVLRALLAYYRESKQNEHAIEMVYRISAEKEFPYGAGADIMRELPVAKQAELQQMFVMALGSYREHKHPGVTFGSGDFAAMITAFYKQLSPDVVKEAIFEVLKQTQAPAEDGKPQEPQQVSVASAQGSVAMGSMYEYRLFQLLPTLRAVDPDEAERLLKQNREVAGMLEKYPQGAGQLQGPQRGEGPPRGGMMMFGAGGPGPRGGPGMGMDRVEMERMQRIVADAEAHPQDALANAATLTSPEMKAQALQGIARATWKKNPSAAKSALKQLVETLPQLELQQQVLPARAAATLYLEMGEAGEARKTIEKGLESAAKLYKQDTDADDPNKALKAYWPSANAYAGLLRLAAEMAPDWAQEQLKEVPDDDLRALAQISMAAALLGQPPGPVTIVSEKKDGMNMMQMSVE
jgi:hypothetical protein